MRNFASQRAKQSQATQENPIQTQTHRHTQANTKHQEQINIIKTNLPSYRVTAAPMQLYPAT